MAGPARAAGLQAENVTKSFGSFRALDDLSLEVKPGEFLTLLGPSGSGKTTFLMILAGFEAPTAGRLLSGGEDITRRPAEERQAGMVFQGYALFPHMSVEKNIAFPLRVRKRSETEIRARVGAMIERVGLKGHERKLPSQLSGGQQQRVALARALVFEPGMLLLDEPFSALDKSLRGAMQAEVKRLHAETGTTFVFVTHDQGEALALSSRVAIFNHGRLLQVGTPEEVYERPASRFVAEFLGEINMLPVSAAKPDGAGGATAVCDERPIRVAGGAVPSGEAVIAIRPEHITVASEPRAGFNSVQARAQNVTYLGNTSRLELQTRGGVPLSVSVPHETARAATQRAEGVWLCWPPEQGFLLPARAG